MLKNVGWLWFYREMSMFLFFLEKGESILEKERRRKRNLNMSEMKRETSKE
jgi:hypothetical protein